MTGTREPASSKWGLAVTRMETRPSVLAVSWLRARARERPDLHRGVQGVLGARVAGRRPPIHVPTAPSRNDSGMTTIPGLSSGNQWKSTPLIIDVGLPDTAGENTISTRHVARPP